MDIDELRMLYRMSFDFINLQAEPPKFTKAKRGEILTTNMLDKNGKLKTPKEEAAPAPETPAAEETKREKYARLKKEVEQLEGLTKLDRG